MKKNMRSMLLLVLALAAVLVPTLALAESGSPFEVDGAGNAFAEEAAASGMTIAGDLYSFGQNVDASSAQVAESAILVGQNIGVNNSTVGGSLRAAGYQVSVANTTVDVNATLAAYSISIGQGFTARAVYAAAQSVSFGGACDTLHVGAQNVTITGTVNGDAHIDAENVTITDTAVITGKLYVKADSEPAVPAGASIGSVEFTQNVTEEAASDVAQAAAGGATLLALLGKLSKLVMMLPGRVILAVLYYFIIRKTVNDASEMVKTRPAAMPVSGFIALISAPVAIILLLCTYVGVPAGMLLMCLYGLALAFAVSFAGCLFGKLVFPKMHTLLAYIIGVAAVTIVKLVPYLGGLVTFGCMIYTLGYFIQKIYLGFGKRSSAPTAPADDVATEVATQVESAK